MAYLCAHDLGVCVLLLLLTLTQSCLGVRTRTLPNVNFQFDDGTCDERQKAFITGAFDDAIYMARSVFESISDLSNDYMLYDLFGIRAIEIVSAKPILDMYYQIATKWEIKASCGVESQAPCNNQFIYGGTDASKGVRVDETLKVGIVFCEEFFRLPSVQSRRNLTLSQLQKSTVVRRYDLGYYSYNQGTSMLRELFRHIERPTSLTRDIEDLWVRTYSSIDSTQAPNIRWFACYGTLCPKLLARIYNDTVPWGVVNAQNYALFALSKYLNVGADGKDEINNLFYPPIDMAEGGLVARPLDNTDLAPAVVCSSCLTGKEPAGSNNYDQSRYIVDEKTLGLWPGMTDVEGADITPSLYLANLSRYPKDFAKSRQMYNDNAKKVQERGWITALFDLTFTCFPEPTPAAKKDRVYQAVNYLCDGAFAVYGEGTAVSPIAWGPTSPLKHYVSMNATNPDKDKAYFTSLKVDPGGLGTPFKFEDAFDGIERENIIAACKERYGYLVEHCSAAVDKTLTIGGQMSNNGKKFTLTVVQSPPKDGLKYDLAGLGKPTCEPVTSKDLWRVAVLVASPIDYSKYCVCWFEKQPSMIDVLCHPSSGGCSDLENIDRAEPSARSCLPGPP